MWLSLIFCTTLSQAMAVFFSATKKLYSGQGNSTEYTATVHLYIRKSHTISLIHEVLTVYVYIKDSTDMYMIGVVLRMINVIGVVLRMINVIGVVLRWSVGIRSDNPAEVRESGQHL